MKSWLIWCCLIAVTAPGQVNIESKSSNHQNQILGELLAPTSSRVFIAAHRGGYETDKEDGAPENSLANIENSRSKGYEIFETDIQRTKDGHFVIVHDPKIERETSGSGRAREMTLLELKKVQKRFRDLSLSEERVATLEEFLERGEGRTVFKADMKSGVSKYFAEVMELVTEHNALECIIFRVPYREANFFHQYQEQGGVIAKHTLMFIASSRKEIDDIKARFDSSTIEIKLEKVNPIKGESLDLIRYAIEKGFVVETHAEGGEDDWAKLVEAGVRVFHTKTPSRMKKLLEVIGK